jgi:hypothetical protein
LRATLGKGPGRIASFSPWVMPTQEGLLGAGHLAYRFLILVCLTSPTSTDLEPRFAVSGRNDEPHSSHG